MNARMLALALVAVVGCFSGCGGSDQAGTPSDDNISAITAAPENTPSNNTSEKKTGGCASATLKGVAVDQVAVVDASCDQASTVMSNAAVAKKEAKYTEGDFDCILTASLYTCSDKGTGYITFTLK